MGLLSKLKGKSRAKQRVFDDFLDDGDISALFSINSRKITRCEAEQLPIIGMGVDLIAESIAEMPVYLYKRDTDGSRVKVDDNRNKLLNMNNGSYSNAFNTIKNLIADYIYHGNGYLDINRDNKNNIISLIHIPYKDISMNKSVDTNQRNARYMYQYWNMNASHHNVLNLVRNPKYDQMIGHGILDEGKLILASLMAI